jgi:hypothetical protein
MPAQLLDITAINTMEHLHNLTQFFSSKIVVPFPRIGFLRYMILGTKNEIIGL